MCASVKCWPIFCWLSAVCLQSVLPFRRLFVLPTWKQMHRTHSGPQRWCCSRSEIKKSSCCVDTGGAWRASSAPHLKVHCSRAKNIFSFDNGIMQPVSSGEDEAPSSKGKKINNGIVKAWKLFLFFCSPSPRWFKSAPVTATERQNGSFLFAAASSEDEQSVRH